MLIDTHLHLDFGRYDNERAAVVARAVEAGVTQMITIGTSLESSQRAIALAERFDAVWAAVGVHPNDAHEWGEQTAEQLRIWAAHPKVVAIGEIGLDYYWKRVPHPVQQLAFEMQLALAAEVGLPVIIHDREAHEDVMTTLRHWVSTLSPEAPRGVLHFFSGDLEMATEAISWGFYLGVDGPLTFKNARTMQKVVAALPLERLVVETDAPFLTPHPHRGQRNEPAYVRHVAEKVAELQGVSFEKVAHQTTTNAQSLFNLKATI